MAPPTRTSLTLLARVVAFARQDRGHGEAPPWARCSSCSVAWALPPRHGAPRGLATPAMGSPVPRVHGRCASAALVTSAEGE
jgi:hypothetical protein